MVFVLMTCENDIPFKRKDNPPKLILNSVFEAEKDTNYIMVGLTGYEHARIVKDATVNVYVNDVLREQITEASSIKYASISSFWGELLLYKTSLKLLPGDHVKIEAKTKDGKYHAWGEDIVPVPNHIEHIDTVSYVKGTDWDFYDNTYLRIKATFTDNPAQKNYYRLVAVRKDTLHYMTDTDSADMIWVTENKMFLDISEDIVLNEGRLPTEDNGLISQTENRAFIFDDSQLNGTYTMTVSAYLSGRYYYGETDFEYVSTAIDLYLISITEAEYYYLRALNLFYSDNYEEAISQPVSFPGNIQGGVGIIGFEAGTSHTIHLPDYISSKNAH